MVDRKSNKQKYMLKIHSMLFCSSAQIPCMYFIICIVIKVKVDLKVSTGVDVI